MTIPLTGTAPIVVIVALWLLFKFRPRGPAEEDSGEVLHLQRTVWALQKERKAQNQTIGGLESENAHLREQLARAEAERREAA